MLKNILLSLIAILLAAEAHAVSCHCFNQRDYDPKAPGAVDPYVLATAGNSLIAGAFGLEKSDIVRQRMTGEEETGIWIAAASAKASGRDFRDFLASRAKEGTWKRALAVSGIDPARLGANFPAALDAGESAAARALAEAVFAKSFKADNLKLSTLRADGATIPETAVALYLGLQMKADPDAIFKKVKSGGTTWGKLLTESNIPPHSLSARIIAQASP